MAYFAELDANNIVLRVVAIGDAFLKDNDGNEVEELGISFCHQLFGADTSWRQTSYNTRAGEHANGKTPFRKNYAGIGYKYDAERDAFIPPKPPGDHWLLDEEKCVWYDSEATPIAIEVTRI